MTAPKRRELAPKGQLNSSMTHPNVDHAKHTRGLRQGAATAWAEECLAEHRAAQAINRARTAMAAFDAGHISLGALLAELGLAGSMAEQVRLRGWDFLEGRVR